MRRFHHAIDWKDKNFPIVFYEFYVSCKKFHWEVSLDWATLSNGFFFYYKATIKRMSLDRIFKLILMTAGCLLKLLMRNLRPSSWEFIKTLKAHRDKTLIYLQECQKSLIALLFIHLLIRSFLAQSFSRWVNILNISGMSTLLNFWWFRCRMCTSTLFNLWIWSHRWCKLVASRWWNTTRATSRSCSVIVIADTARSVRCRFGWLRWRRSNQNLTLNTKILKTILLRNLTLRRFIKLLRILIV